MVQVGPVCKFVWCESVQARVWTVLIVVGFSVFNNVFGVAVAGEDVFVQALVTQAAIE